MKACFILLSFVVLLFSCSKDAQSPVFSKPSGCDSTTMRYSSDIEPIVNANCSFGGCHCPGGEGSFDYTTYEGFAARIRAGRVLDRLALPVDDPQHMPEHYELNPCDLYKLRIWIAQGYPNN